MTHEFNFSHCRIKHSRTSANSGLVSVTMGARRAWLGVAAVRIARVAVGRGSRSARGCGWRGARRRCRPVRPSCARLPWCLARARAVDRCELASRTRVCDRAGALRCERARNVPRSWALSGRCSNELAAPRRVARLPEAPTIRARDWLGCRRSRDGLLSPIEEAQLRALARSHRALRP